MGVQTECSAIETEIRDSLAAFMDTDGRLLSVTAVHTVDDDLFVGYHRGITSRESDGSADSPDRKRMDSEQKAWILSLMREANLAACTQADDMRGGLNLHLVARGREEAGGERAAEECDDAA